MTIGLDVDAKAPRTSVLGVMSITGAWWVESRNRQADAPDTRGAGGGAPAARRSYRHGK